MAELGAMEVCDKLTRYGSEAVSALGLEMVRTDCYGLLPTKH